MIAAPATVLDRLPEDPSIRRLDERLRPVTWTDDYSNLFGILGRGEPIP